MTFSWNYISNSKIDIKLPDFKMYFKYLAIKIEWDKHKKWA